MKIENVAIVTLDPADVDRAKVNGGLPVDLPPQTVQVVVRVKQDQKE